jgi:hypothetical protein
MNQVIKSNGFVGAVHTSHYLLGANVKERHECAYTKRLNRYIERSRGRYNKLHGKPAEHVPFWNKNLVGWFAVEIYLVVVEVAYFLQ